MPKKNLFNKLKNSTQEHLLSWGSYLLLILLGLYFSWWKLAQIAPGLSSSELQTIVHNLSWRGWANLPISPLTHLGQWLVVKGWGISIFGLRSVSVIFSLVALCLIFMALSSWLGRKVAVLTVAVVICSAWWLNLARLATGGGELMLWLALFGFAAWQLHQHGSRLWWLIWCLAMVGLCYSPGGLWMMLGLLLVALLSTDFLGSLRHIHLRYKILGLLIYLVGLAPLGYTLWQRPATVRDFLGLDHGLGVRSGLSNLWHGFSALFVQLPIVDAAHGLHGYLVLRVVFGALIVLGLWSLVKKHSGLDSSFRLLVITMLVVGVLLTGLSASATTGVFVIIPAIFLIGAGLWFLVRNWQWFFPLNPYPRALGLVLIITLVSWTSVSGYRLYFNAWAHSPNTAYAFSPRLSDARNTIQSESIKNGCRFVYASNENKWAAATTTLFGRFSRHVSCKYPTISQVTLDDAQSHQPDREQRTTTPVDKQQTLVLGRQNYHAPEASSSFPGQQNSFQAVQNITPVTSGQNYTLFISAQAWTSISDSQQAALLSYPHSPVVNYQADEGLDYWVFQINQKVDTINK